MLQKKKNRKTAPSLSKNGTSISSISDENRSPHGPYVQKPISMVKVADRIPLSTLSNGSQRVSNVRASKRQRRFIPPTTSSAVPDMLTGNGGLSTKDPSTISSTPTPSGIQAVCIHIFSLLVMLWCTEIIIWFLLRCVFFFSIEAGSLRNIFKDTSTNKGKDNVTLSGYNSSPYSVILNSEQFNRAADTKTPSHKGILTKDGYSLLFLLWLWN